MLVLMACTIAVSAPIMMVGGVIMALREDLGLGWILAVVVPALFVCVGFVVSRMVPELPADAGAASTRSTGCCASRSPASGWSARSSASRTRPQRFGKANDDLTDVAVARRPLDGDDVPAGDAGRERLQRRGDLVRRAPRRQRRDAGRRADRVPLLPDADPDVGDDGDLHADDDPARRGLRATASPRCSTPRPRCRSRPTPVAPDPAQRGHLDLEHVTFAYPGAEEPVLADVSFSARPGQTVAVIGSTGAGKTTLVNLVPRLFDATDGRRSASAGPTYAASTPTCSGSRSGWCRRRPTSSAARSAATSSTASRTRPRTRCGRRSRSRRAATSSRRCPRVSTRRSPRAAPTSPAASGSGWRSRGR